MRNSNKMKNIDNIDLFASLKPKDDDSPANQRKDTEQNLFGLEHKETIVSIQTETTERAHGNSVTPLNTISQLKQEDFKDRQEREATLAAQKQHRKKAFKKELIQSKLFTMADTPYSQTQENTKPKSPIPKPRFYAKKKRQSNFSTILPLKNHEIPETQLRINRIFNKPFEKSQILKLSHYIRAKIGYFTINREIYHIFSLIEALLLVALAVLLGVYNVLNSEHDFDVLYFWIIPFACGSVIYAIVETIVRFLQYNKYVHHPELKAEMELGMKKRYSFFMLNSLGIVLNLVFFSLSLVFMFQVMLYPKLCYAVFFVLIAYVVFHKMFLVFVYFTFVVFQIPVVLVCLVGIWVIFMFKGLLYQWETFKSQRENCTIERAVISTKVTSPNDLEGEDEHYSLLDTASPRKAKYQTHVKSCIQCDSKINENKEAALTLHCNHYYHPKCFQMEVEKKNSYKCDCGVSFYL